MLSAALSSGLSRHWCHQFRSNAHCSEIPWDDSYVLRPAERAAIADSVRQFQLGEGARGRGFLRRGSEFASRIGDPAFAEALRLFVAEEQRHSAFLARFLVRQKIPLQPAHWVNSSFRGLRKLAGLELCATVLVTAELIAMPYYSALRRATASPMLQAICRRILRDETRHLQFQASMLARLRYGRSRLLQQVSTAAHFAFLLGTMAIAWVQHRSVFQRARVAFPQFSGECIRQMGGLIRETERCRRALQEGSPNGSAENAPQNKRALEYRPAAPV